MHCRLPKLMTVESTLWQRGQLGGTMYSSRNEQKHQVGRCSPWYTRAGCYPMNCQWLTDWMNHGTLGRAKHAEIRSQACLEKKSQTDKNLAGSLCVAGAQSCPLGQATLQTEASGLYAFREI